MEDPRGPVIRSGFHGETLTNKRCSPALHRKGRSIDCRKIPEGRTVPIQEPPGGGPLGFSYEGAGKKGWGRFFRQEPPGSSATPFPNQLEEFSQGIRKRVFRLKPNEPLYLFAVSKKDQGRNTSDAQVPCHLRALIHIDSS